MPYLPSVVISHMMESIAFFLTHIFFLKHTLPVAFLSEGEAPVGTESSQSVLPALCVCVCVVSVVSVCMCVVCECVVSVCMCVCGE